MRNIKELFLLSLAASSLLMGGVALIVLVVINIIGV